MPYRAAGSQIELDPATLEPFQWHYSPQTLQESLIGPSGLVVEEQLLYGERLPFYELSRRLPRWLDAARRPWDTLLTAALLHETSEPSRASAALSVLRKPPT